MSDHNDLQGFLDEAWQHLSRGVADRRSPARYPTFATVSPDGKPEVRTVALRGASRLASLLEVHTDTATAKVTALEHTPIAAFHIWLPRADLQIRLITSVSILTGRCIDNHWEKVPPASRVSYGTMPNPGYPIADVYAYTKLADRGRFAVLNCILKEIDLVHLGKRHRRALFVSDDGWTGSWLAP